MRIFIIALALVALPLTNIAAQTPAPAGPPNGITRMPLLDNDVVTVTRFQFAPGAREMPHSHPSSQLTIQLTRGELDLLKGASHTVRVVEPGNVERTVAGTTHANANSGTTPWDVLSVMLKGNVDVLNVRSASTTYVQTTESQQVSNRFDLLLLPLTAARIELKIGNETKTEFHESGAAIFIARNTTYSIRNAGTAPFTAVAIEIP